MLRVLLSALVTGVHFPTTMPVLMATIFIYITRIWSAASDHVLQAGLYTNLELVIHSTIVAHQEPATAAPAHVWQERGAVMAPARQRAVTATLAITEPTVDSPPATAPMHVLKALAVQRVRPVARLVLLATTETVPCVICATLVITEVPPTSRQARAVAFARQVSTVRKILFERRATAPVSVLQVIMALPIQFERQAPAPVSVTPGTSEPPPV
jgi:hypothetical protein